MSTCCGPGAAWVSPAPHTGRPAAPCAARAHLVLPGHGAAPLQQHALDTPDGRPGRLRVPEQRRGARGRAAGTPVWLGPQAAGHPGRCSQETRAASLPAGAWPAPHPTRRICPRWLCGSGCGDPGAGPRPTLCARGPAAAASPPQEGTPWDPGAHRRAKNHCIGRPEGRERGGPLQQDAEGLGPWAGVAAIQRDP